MPYYILLRSSLNSLSLAGILNLPSAESPAYQVENTPSWVSYSASRASSNRIDGNNQVDSLIAGMKKTAVRFEEVSQRCENLLKRLPKQDQRFFRDNLAAPCHYMAALSHSLYHFVSAYKGGESNKDRKSRHIHFSFML